MSDKVAAYNAGYDAWLMGKDSSWNMYKPGSPEHSAWFDGYADAQAEDHDPYTTGLAAFAWLVILVFVIACVYFLVVI